MTVKVQTALGEIMKIFENRLIKIIVLSLLAVTTMINPAFASDLSHSAATQFISNYYQAIRKHDLKTVNSMINDDAAIKVLWMQANPPQTFTLSQTDYLQQLKATWRFASNDLYEIKNVSVNTVNGITVVSLQERQTRVLFGKKAGQQNDLKITLSHNNKHVRISAIHNKTELW
jgi:ketosteroid isomerase-like protein